MDYLYFVGYMQPEDGRIVDFQWIIDVILTHSNEMLSHDH